MDVRGSSKDRGWYESAEVKEVFRVHKVRAYSLIGIADVIVSGRYEQDRAFTTQGLEPGVTGNVQYFLCPMLVLFVDVIDTDDAVVVFQEVAQCRADPAAADESDIHFKK
jgi:hypothetical protein